MNKLKKQAKDLRKKLKGNISISSLASHLETLGYSTVFFNTEDGDELLKAYGLTNVNEKAFTYCGTTKIIFINGNLSFYEKLHLLLHELGHILLNHLDENKLNFTDKCVLENEAEAFSYMVLNYKNDYVTLSLIVCIVLSSFISLTFGTYINSNNNSMSVSKIQPITIPTITIQTTEQPITETSVSEFVKITKTGTKYHRPTCRYVKNKNCTSLTIEEAQKNYSPCSVCNP